MTIIEKLDRSKMLYRPCVGVVLLNSDNRVFVGERIDSPGAWQMPQGGVDEGEEPQDAALRELGEEVGTRDAEILRIAPRKLRYDLPDHLVMSLWNGKYRGQEQVWVAARFLGSDHDINLNAFDPPEFTNWQWINLRETMDLIVPFKREIYKSVIEMFSDLVE